MIIIGTQAFFSLWHGSRIPSRSVFSIGAMKYPTEDFYNHALSLSQVTFQLEQLAGHSSVMFSLEEIPPPVELPRCRNIQYCQDANPKTYQNSSSNFSYLFTKVYKILQINQYPKSLDTRLKKGKSVHSDTHTHTHKYAHAHTHRERLKNIFFLCLLNFH
jgi:hypothetical protein